MSKGKIYLFFRIGVSIITACYEKLSAKERKKIGMSRSTTIKNHLKLFNPAHFTLGYAKKRRFLSNLKILEKTKGIIL